MKRLISPLVIIAIAVVLRLLPHEPNVAPITAMALFGGAYINKKFALIVPLSAMFISDIFLGFHATIPFVYVSFLISGLIGLYLQKNKNFLSVASGTLFASLLFYLMTNFGVWLVSGMYPHTFSGLLEAYILALPFYRNTILGDLIYTGVFFAGYEIIWQFISVRAKLPSSEIYK